jgi:hypothetical protein
LGNPSYRGFPTRPTTGDSDQQRGRESFLTEREIEMDNNYIPAILKAITQAGGIKPGGLYHIDIQHDDDCDLLSGKGPCNCHPTVRKPVPHRLSRHEKGMN